jgi:anti-sigma B factor antagonist
MSDDVRGFEPDVLHIEAMYDDTSACIVLSGEFDMTGTERFWAYVSEAVEAHPASITVVARGLNFIDSPGLVALLRVRDAAREAGVGFHVRDPSPALRRIAELTGLEELLPDD